jgi:Putative polyhydroxyalkanoic acid system protein (PHA_gran_rgn)
MRIAIPHKLSKAEVHKRLDEHADELANFIPGGMAEVEKDWVDDEHMALGVTALGSFVGADLAIEDKQVVVEVELPMALKLMKGKIERSIRDNTTKLLK